MTEDRLRSRDGGVRLHRSHRSTWATPSALAFPVRLSGAGPGSAAYGPCWLDLRESVNPEVLVRVREVVLHARDDARHVRIILIDFQPGILETGDLNAAELPEKPTLVSQQIIEVWRAADLRVRQPAYAQILYAPAVEALRGTARAIRRRFKNNRIWDSRRPRPVSPFVYGSCDCQKQEGLKELRRELHRTYNHIRVLSFILSGAPIFSGPFWTHGLHSYRRRR